MDTFSNYSSEDGYITNADEDTDMLRSEDGVTEFRQQDICDSEKLVYTRDPSVIYVDYNDKTKKVICSLFKW